GSPSTDPNTLAEVAREIVNTLGGAFKRSALSSRLDLTTGLPEDVSEEEQREAFHVAVAAKQWYLGWANQSLAVSAVIRRAGVCRGQVEALTEGMGRSSELRSPAGALLVAAGTRLTASAIRHISERRGAGFEVQVASADAA